MAHSISLYNFNKDQIWRFRVRTEPVREPTVIIEDDSLQSLEGRHFTVFTEGLIGLYRGAKAFILEDMLRSYRKYLSDPNLSTWIRRYLSIQYLASQKEMKHLYIESGGSEDAFERAFGSHPYYYGIVKTLVSRFYLFKLAFQISRRIRMKFQKNFEKPLDSIEGDIIILQARDFGKPKLLRRRQSMKIILSARRHHYVARVTIFFVTVALIVGMVGCDQSAPPVESQYITQVAAGGYHTVGLMSDGTAVAVGDTRYGQCAVRLWRDIIQVAAGCYHTAGLKDDGTVVATGSTGDGQCDVGGWTGIAQVAAGDYHTVGVKTDGTVVAAGYDYYGRCDVGGWTDIIRVAAGHLHTVGLKDDGTVAAVGYDYSGQCDVGSWTGIVKIAAGYFHTVGVKTDGTVVAAGHNYYGQCDIDGWTDIVQVAAGRSHTVGVKTDGTVVAVGYNGLGQCDVGSWTDIVQVAADGDHTVGVTSNSTVVAVGLDDDGQCDVGSWALN